MTTITAMMIRGNETYTWAGLDPKTNKWAGVLEMLKNGVPHCTLLSHTIGIFDTEQEAIDSINRVVAEVRKND